MAEVKNIHKVKKLKKKIVKNNVKDIAKKSSKILEWEKCQFWLNYTSLVKTRLNFRISNLSVLKVSKSQKHFFLKLHCPKHERNIRQNSALEFKKWLNQQLKAHFHSYST